MTYLGLFFSCRILVVSTTQAKKSALQMMARIMMIGSLTESHPSPQVSMIALCEDIDIDDLGTSSESVLLHLEEEINNTVTDCLKVKVKFLDGFVG